MPNVLSPRDLVFRPDNMDETVPHTVYDFPFCDKKCEHCHEKICLRDFRPGQTQTACLTAQLICAFVFAYAKSRFSHDMANILQTYLGSQ